MRQQKIDIGTALVTGPQSAQRPLTANPQGERAYRMVGPNGPSYVAAPINHVLKPGLTVPAGTIAIGMAGDAQRQEFYTPPDVLAPSSGGLRGTKSLLRPLVRPSAVGYVKGLVQPPVAHFSMQDQPAARLLGPGGLRSWSPEGLRKASEAAAPMDLLRQAAARGASGNTYARPGYPQSPLPGGHFTSGPQQQGRQVTHHGTQIPQPLPAQQQPQMSVSAAGADFIRSWEALRQDVYRGADAQNQTIGYGHKLGRGEKLTHVTPEQAEALFQKDLAVAEGLVRRYLTRPVTQDQFDALVSEQFNIGNRVSPPLRDIDRTGNVTKEDFTRHYITANGHPAHGLRRRRDAEWDISSRGEYHGNH